MITFSIYFRNLIQLFLESRFPLIFLLYGLSKCILLIILLVLNNNAPFTWTTTLALKLNSLYITVFRVQHFSFITRLKFIKHF